MANLIYYTILNVGLNKLTVVLEIGKLNIFIFFKRLFNLDAGRTF